MTEDMIEKVLDEFAAWAERTTRTLGGDGDEAGLLLRLARDHLGVEDPGDLVAIDLEELLLEVYPRKVTVLNAEDAADVIPTVRDLLAFLHDTGRIPAGEIKRLEREVDRIEPRFLDAVMDPANWGPARSVVQAMAGDGIDLSDQAAVDRWIGGYNTRVASGLPEQTDPYDDEVDLKEAFGLPDRLPPLRLPPETELASAAGTSRLLARARELALWVGDRRGVTEDRELSAADAVTAARALGIAVPEKDRHADGVLPGMPGAPPIRRMQDLPELVQLWHLAAVIEFLAFGADHVTVGAGVEDWPGGDDDVLDVWETALTATISDSLLIDADLHVQHDLDFHGVGGALLVMLFLAGGEGIPLAELSEMIRETATAELPPGPARKTWKSWTRAHGDPARTLLARLEDLGAVEIGGEVARLTPLAVWAMREQLVDSGVEVPLLPPVDEMSVADLIAAAEGNSEAEMAAEEAAWLKLRRPEDAANELLEVAAGGGPAARIYATSVATRLGAAAEPRWREALEVQQLRPYAKIALGAIAGVEPPDFVPGLEPRPEDLAWLLTDVLAATSDALGPEELEHQLRDAVPPGQEQAVFEMMWRIPPRPRRTS